MDMLGCLWGHTASVAEVSKTWSVTLVDSTADHGDVILCGWRALSDVFACLTLKLFRRHMVPPILSQDLGTGVEIGLTIPRYLWQKIHLLPLYPHVA